MMMAVMEDTPNTLAISFKVYKFNQSLISAIISGERCVDINSNESNSNHNDTNANELNFQNISLETTQTNTNKQYRLCYELDINRLVTIGCL